MSDILYENDDATAKELLVELRKPGNVFVGALIKEDVIMVKAVKSDLVRYCERLIKNWGKEIESGFSYSRHDNNDLTLCAAH